MLITIDYDKTSEKANKFFKELLYGYEVPKIFKAKLQKELLNNKYYIFNKNLLDLYLTKKNMDYEIKNNFKKVSHTERNIAYFHLRAGIDIRILFPKVPITNGTQNHIMEDLFISITTNAVHKMGIMYGTRFKQNYLEANVGFRHPHLRKERFGTGLTLFCLGESNLYKTLGKLNFKFFNTYMKELQLEGIFFELENFLTRQATQTSPYLRIGELYTKDIELSPRYGNSLSYYMMDLNYKPSFEDLYISNNTIKVKWNKRLENLVLNSKKGFKVGQKYYKSIGNPESEKAHYMGKSRFTGIVFNSNRKTCSVTENYIPDAKEQVGEKETPIVLRELILKKINKYYYFILNQS